MHRLAKSSKRSTLFNYDGYNVFGLSMGFGVVLKYPLTSGMQVLDVAMTSHIASVIYRFSLVMLLIAATGCTDGGVPRLILGVHMPPLTVQARVHDDSSRACADEGVLLVLPDLYHEDQAIQAALSPDSIPRDPVPPYFYAYLRTDQNGRLDYTFPVTTRRLGYAVYGLRAFGGLPRDEQRSLKILLRLAGEEDLYAVEVTGSNPETQIFDSKSVERFLPLIEAEDQVAIEVEVRRGTGQDVIELDILKECEHGAT